MVLTILTFNTCGVDIFNRNFYANVNKVIDIINNENIDIINFQEVVFYNHLWKLKQGLKDFKYISYKKSVLGPHAGLVTFSKYPIKKKNFIIFKKNGDLYNLSIIHILAQRGMLVSSIQGFEIVNTHFSANISNKWDTENHYIKVLKAQSSEFNQLLNQDEKRTYLCSGDFNIPKLSNLYKGLVGENLDDIFYDIHKSTHLGDIFLSEIDNLNVDYILLSKINKLKYKVINRKFLFDHKFNFGNRNEFLSDHIGLVASVEINE